MNNFALQNGSSHTPVIEEASSNIIGAEKSYPFNEIYDIVETNKRRTHLYSYELYKHMYDRSLNDQENFWKEIANEHLRWIHPFTKVASGSFIDANTAWFLNGKLNVCDNCVDRWAEKTPENIALIWEGDEIGNNKYITYKELQIEVCRCANLLKHLGVKKGDIVCIYLPMILELVYFMLACSRIGAPHSVVFAGFSSSSLADRINDAGCKIVITADQGIRAGKLIHLKNIMDDALKMCPTVDKCVVHIHTGNKINWVEGRDFNSNELVKTMRPYCPLEVMDSEDTLFILYTSGSTGKPKGIVHSTAGFILCATLQIKYAFDVHPGDVFQCVADIGWITGHTSCVYGPLSLGVTSIIFESIPTYPDPGRYWYMTEKHKSTQIYTSPTAIRSLMKFGDDWPSKYDLSSLRSIASAGEPLNPEAWRWIYNAVGNGKVSIVDNYAQTESPIIIITALPGATKTKPGSVTLPFLGFDLAILDPITGKEIKGNPAHGLLVISKPFPSMFRSVLNNHQRYLENYFKPYPGYYLTGDGAVRDQDGYYWISGRVDDTLNVSGHRLGAAEIEHALVQCPVTAEAAVVGYPHDIKGTGIFCYVTLKDSVQDLSKEQICALLKTSVRTLVGPIATPDVILISPALPKTRSGKIMRRILRLIATNRSSELGDVSTLNNPESVDDLVNQVKELNLF